jgi:hypothetical protein
LKIAFRNYRRRRTCPECEEAPEKGRPPPGGEEAEVVVYQPRGVGLMHTRPKPSNDHYTHGDVADRKCSFRLQGRCDLENCSIRQLA